MVFFKKINVRTSTIFDFTNDPKIINDQFELKGISSKQYSKDLPIETRIFDLIALADLLKNTKLKSSIFKAFKKELSTFGFE